MMIIKPIKATYGCKDNSHDLLSFEGDDSPPRQLLGWTDMPSGHISPKEKWWPVINCGPVDDKWWALWNIIPDNDATRSGMVKSEVFLWKLDDIDDVVDISTYIFQLVQKHDCNEPSEQLLTNLVQAMIIENDIIVVDSISSIPNIINVLWKKLWKNAKKNFSVRMAFSPPQILVNCKHPSFYCVPPSLKNQWYLNNVKIIDEKEKFVCLRATKYLVKENVSDEIFKQLLVQIGEPPGNLNFLNRLSRASDNIENYNHTRDFDSAISALRTIILCAPQSNNAEKIKKELLTNIKKNLKEDLDYQQILSLSNLENSSLPQGMMPETELTNWIKSNITKLKKEQIIKILERSNGKSLPWWQQSVLNGIELVIDNSDNIVHIFQWLGIKYFIEIFNLLHINRHEFSENIYALSIDYKITHDDATIILAWSMSYKWPKLHALAICHLYDQINVFEQQYNSMPNWSDGVPFLIDFLDDETLVQLTEDERLQPFLDLVIQKIIITKTILDHIDIDKNNDFNLWIKQLELGGIFYPLQCNKSYFCEKVCRKLTKIPSLITFKMISKEIAQFVLAMPNRDVIWSQLSEEQSHILAKDLVKNIIPGMQYIYSVTTEEKYFLFSLKDNFNVSDSIEPELLAMYLSKKIPHDEYQIAEWFNKLGNYQWSIHLHSLCELIHKNKWGFVANKIFNSSYGLHPETPQFQNGIKYFSELLDFKSRVKLMFNRDYLLLTDRMDLVRYTAEVCAELAHDRLEYFWVRAGGQVSKLKLTGNASEQWLYAAKLAQNGSLDGGLKALINELLVEFPRNDTLLSINKLLHKF